jgi:hypothetical protein
MIDAGELVGVPGTAATPSQDFDRWAINVDVRLSVDSLLGRTTVYGEATAGVNMDRGMFQADPIASGGDVRELGYYGAITHEVSALLVGVRYDYYNPNADFFLKRQGKLLPSTDSLHTTSPVLGVKIGAHARVSAQYDFNRNYLAFDERGVPTSLADNRLTVRLQGEL